MILGHTVKDNVKTIWNAPVSEQGLGFRRHTLCFSSAMFLVGTLCFTLQAAEVSQHRSFLPQSNSAALHYYNGFWNGFGLWLTSVCGILTAIFLPDRQPVNNQNSAGEITLVVPSLNGYNFKTFFKKYSHLTLKVLLATHICLFGSGLTSLVISARLYPNFLQSFNATVTNQQMSSLGTDLFLTTTVDPTSANFTVFKPPKTDPVLKAVRVTCLALQALLTLCTLMGLFLTAVTGTITLNRVLLQDQIANQGTESAEATLRRQTSRSASARSKRRKSVVSAVRKVSRTMSTTVRNRKTSALTQPEILTKTKVRGTLESGLQAELIHPVQQTQRSSPTVFDELRSSSFDQSQSREASLQTLAEFLRNRKISQHQLRVPSRYELQEIP